MLANRKGNSGIWPLPKDGAGDGSVGSSTNGSDDDSMARYVKSVPSRRQPTSSSCDVRSTGAVCLLIELI
jgi:hypothetical protein